MKYLVIGDDDTVLGFRYAGVEGTIVHTRAEVKEALSAAAADGNVGTIIITERAASLAEADVSAMRAGTVAPVLVEIPDRQGPMPSKKSLADLIREAVGIRI